MSRTTRRRFLGAATAAAAGSAVVLGAAEAAGAPPAQAQTTAKAGRYDVTDYGAQGDLTVQDPPFVAVLPSGDTTGVTDTTNINNAMSLGYAVGLQGSGTYYLSAPINMTSTGSILDLGGSTVQLGSWWSGSEMVNVTGSYCIVRNGQFNGGSSTVTSNPAASAIVLTAATFAVVEAVSFKYINGWCVQSDCASASGYGTVLARLYGLVCAGGIQIIGAAHTTQHSVSDINLERIGVSSGTYANLDCLMLQDAEDCLIENFDAGIADASTGSAIHLKGSCHTCYFTNVDCGVYPDGSGSNSTLLIESDTNGGPYDLRFTNFVFQYGQVGVTISASSGTRIRFVNGHIQSNFTHGMVVSGAVEYIELDTVEFGGNGAGASGANYDLNWSGRNSTNGFVRNCLFTTNIESEGTAGVVNNVSVAAGHGVYFTNTAFKSTNSTGIRSSFTNVPALVRDCLGVNPVGPITVTVPASGTATSVYGVDATYYVQSNSSHTSVKVDGADSPISIPTHTTVAVFVSALSTITPTYIGKAPTWAVYLM